MHYVIPVSPCVVSFHYLGTQHVDTMDVLVVFFPMHRSFQTKLSPPHPQKNANQWLQETLDHKLFHGEIEKLFMSALDCLPRSLTQKTPKKSRMGFLY